jgi:hypothetical protein
LTKVKHTHEDDDAATFQEIMGLLLPTLQNNKTHQKNEKSLIDPSIMVKLKYLWCHIATNEAPNSFKHEVCIMTIIVMSLNYGDRYVCC